MNCHQTSVPSQGMKPAPAGASQGQGRATLNPAALLCAKRLYDAFFAGLGLFVLSPVLLLIAIAIKLADRGPVFYRQLRIGQYGTPFAIWKFRTMVADADQRGPALTTHRDGRVTRVGRILRRTKLDELPQLWNVWRGEMSLVGPRPEVARYVECYTPEQRQILQHKPGITDLASLRFREEESLLQTAADAEAFYVQQCLPRKLKLNQQYARQANPLTDTWIILQTICPYWTGVLVLYAILLTTSFWFANALVGTFVWSGAAWRQFAARLPIVLGVELISLLARRHCKGLLCYFGFPELWQLAIGLVQACLILLGIGLISASLSPPANLLITNFCVSLLLLSGFRVLLRLWRERIESCTDLPSGPAARVGIIGAGTLGAQLARYMNAHKNIGRTAVAFFDDDDGKWQKQIHQVPVVGMPECLAQGWSEKLDEVAIALPDATPARLQQITQLVESTKLRVFTINWLAAIPSSDTASHASAS